MEMGWLSGVADKATSATYDATMLATDDQTTPMRGDRVKENTLR